ncbi:Malate dehydrogenase, chloroplastic [Folsomia candida]|uniref:Malate dehydrogenase, chloroplastic n=1 Tax=Folsomia candida TaxID=158441 RepID=A0A226DQE6_FOLCA|nr:Malate dehydrogenase, chloroplastic [Folsomia candida]
MKVSLFIIPVMYGIIGTYKPCSTPSMLREFLPRCENLDCLGDANVAWILVAFLNGLFQMGLFYIYATVVVFTLVHVVLYPSLMIKLWIGGMDRQIQNSQGRSILPILHQYRVAQITENLVNAVMEKPFFIILLTFTIIGQICTLYIIFTSWSHLSVGIMMLFLLVGFNFGNVIHIFLHSLCYPNVTSREFIKSMRGSISARNTMSTVDKLKHGLSLYYCGKVKGWQVEFEDGRPVVKVTLA